MPRNTCDGRHGFKTSCLLRGAYVFTCLAGKALECVEDMDPESYRKSGGEKVHFTKLDERFPHKDKSDEMSEALTQIFSLKSTEGETLKAWVSRATEAFHRCKAKVNVSFPEEAQGRIILRRSGLTEEQQAVRLARSQGVLKKDDIGRAMRSCYPDFTAPRKDSRLPAWSRPSLVPSWTVPRMPRNSTCKKSNGSWPNMTKDFQPRLRKR